MNHDVLKGANQPLWVGSDNGYACKWRFAEALLNVHFSSTADWRAM